MKKIALFIIVTVAGLLIIGFKNNRNQTGAWHYTIKKITLRQKPFSIEAADLNGDKIKDLVIANGEDSSVTVLIGTGNGNFIEARGSPFAAGSSPNDIAISDFNKDGKPDLAFANHTRKYLTVLTGDGAGNFMPLKGSPFPVDVIPHTHGIAVADFNGDGNTDLLTDSWGNDRLAILFGTSSHGFNNRIKYLQVGKHPYQRARVADLNKDGHADIITTNLDGNSTTILLGDGKGDFKEAEGSPFACGDSPFGIAIGDINQDGDPDLAIINSPSITSSNIGNDGLTILLGDGTGKFKPMPGAPFSTGKAPSRVAVGDLNGDGFPDVAVTNYQGNNISIFIMKKDGLASAYTVPIGKYPDGVAITDLNGDGKNDIAVTNSGEHSMEILFSR